MSESHGGSPYGVGVYRHSLCNKFVARGVVGGKTVYLGLHDTIEEAQVARRAALNAYYRQRSFETKCAN
jgi:hypothetical protein